MNDDTKIKLKELDSKRAKLRAESKDIDTKKKALLLKGKYVIFAYMSPIFIDPDYALQYYYYTNPTFETNDDMYSSKNPNTITCMNTSPMSRDGLDYALTHPKEAKQNSIGKFIFSKSEIQKILKDAPDDIVPILKVSVKPAIWILTHDNNKYIVSDAYHDE